jgi:regulatory protein
VRPGGRRASATAREPESAQIAYVEAIKRLARQPQSRATLRQRLLTLGYVDAAVDAALDRAEGDGYLNDREFAASLVRRRTKGRGHALIAQELRAKGIDEAAAGPALAAVDAEVEAEQALALGRSLVANRRLADAEALAAYIGARLSRRGFSSGLVYRVCRLLSDEWEVSGRFDSPQKRD